jgi:hypothetical protein
MTYYLHKLYDYHRHYEVAPHASPSIQDKHSLLKGGINLF